MIRFTAKHDIKETLPLGFTFSLTVNQLSFTSGILVRWTKGFDVEGALGEDVVQLLAQALKRKNVSTIIL